MKTVHLVLFAQLGLMLPAWVAFVTQPAGLGTLYLVAYAVALGFAVAVYTGWKSLRSSAARPAFCCSVLATCFTVGTPFVMDGFGLPRVPMQTIAVAACVLALLVAGTLLANRQRWQPGTILGGRSFNKGMLSALAVVIAFIWVPIVVWLAAGLGAGPAGSSLRSLFLIYYTVVGALAAMLVSVTFLTAIAGLFRHAGSRLIHAGQLVASVVLLLSLSLVAGGIGLALANPG